MDVGYGDCDDVGFEHSLFLWSQVMSAPRPETVVLDAGLKGYSAESGVPRVAAPAGSGWEGLLVQGASDEHSKVDATAAERVPEIGAKLRLIPPHCDPTVNLHDWLVCIRGEVVVDLWPVSGRGPGL